MLIITLIIVVLAVASVVKQIRSGRVSRNVSRETSLDDVDLSYNDYRLKR